MSAAEPRNEGEKSNGGAPSRHIDPCTARLDMLGRSYIDVQQTRLALTQRELDDAIVALFAEGEKKLSAALSRTLRQHTLWPWLSQFPGLGGAHVAIVIGRIGDPRRFPGQRCTEGHYLPPLYAVGAPCPVAASAHEIEGADGDGAQVAGADDKSPGSDIGHVCPGVMEPPRETTGVRSLWHYAGLHVVDGRSPRRRKGVQSDWEPRIRASCLMDKGIAAQIVLNRTAIYRDVYDATKARLTAERGMPAEGAAENENQPGGLTVAGRSDSDTEIEGPPGSLRPIQIDRIALKVAAKAFLGDLLTEWKRIANEPVKSNEPPNPAKSPGGSSTKGV